jgi:hypothetical protein
MTAQADLYRAKRMQSWRAKLDVPPPPPAPEPDRSEILLEGIQQSLLALAQSMKEQLALTKAMKDQDRPAVVVDVEPPDLLPIIDAINKLKVQATPDEIGRAIASYLPALSGGISEERLEKLLERISKIVPPPTVIGGGGGTVRLGKSDLKVLTDAMENISVDIGEVNIDFPDEYPLPAAQVATLTPQSDALTDSQLRATPVDVEGTVAVVNFPATQPVSGTVAVSNFPATQPVSGTVTANLGTIDGVATEATLLALLAAASLTPVSTLAATVDVTGPTDVLTPAAGKKLRLRWLFAQSDPSNSGTSVITFRLGGTVVYKFELDAGQPFAHSMVVDGAVDGALSVELGNTNPVYVNVDYEEV